MKDFLIVVGGLIFCILFGTGIIRYMENVIFRMGGIMDKHQAQNCERAIEYKLDIPHYCNVESLSGSIETGNRI